MQSNDTIRTMRYSGLKPTNYYSTRVQSLFNQIPHSRLSVYHIKKIMMESLQGMKENWFRYICQEILNDLSLAYFIPQNINAGILKESSASLEFTVYIYPTNVTPACEMELRQEYPTGQDLIQIRMHVSE